MKKVLSVVLCAIMIFCCIPFASFADTPAPAELTADVLTENNYSINGSYSVPSGKKLTIPSGTTLTLEPGARVEVYGQLNVNGEIVSTGGILVSKCWYSNGWQHGVITNGNKLWSKVTGEHFFADVVFDGLPADYINDEHYVSEAVWTRSTHGSIYEYLEAGNAEIDTEKNTVIAYHFPNPIWNGLNIASMGIVTATGENAVVIAEQIPLNQYLFFRMKMVGANGADKYNTYEALKFNFNKVPVKWEQGVCAVLIDSAGVIECASPKTWNENKYLKSERIYLPSGSGYRIYGENGEASENDQTVSLKYGQEFRFRLELDKEYDNSDYKVYCVNTYQWNDDRYATPVNEIATPRGDWGGSSIRAVCFNDGESVPGFYVDDYGVYHISAENMITECSIVVIGVAKNETINFAGKIVEMLKNIFATIRGFFESFFSAFGLG